MPRKRQKLMSSSGCTAAKTFEMTLRDRRPTSHVPVYKKKTKKNRKKWAFEYLFFFFAFGVGGSEWGVDGTVGGGEKG